MRAVFSCARPGFELGLAACVFLFLPVLALASRGAAPLAAVAGVLAFLLAASSRTADWRGLHQAAELARGCSRHIVSRPLAVTTTTRSGVLPDIPTIGRRSEMFLIGLICN